MAKPKKPIEKPTGISFDENGAIQLPKSSTIVELTNETGKVRLQWNEKGNITAIGGVCKAKDFKENFASAISNLRDYTLGISRWR